MASAEPKRCLGCGYILEGLPENRCPECGREFDPLDAGTYCGRPASGLRYLVAIVASLAGVILSLWLTVVCFRPTSVLLFVCGVLCPVMPLLVFFVSGHGAWRALLGPRPLVRHRAALFVAVALLASILLVVVLSLLAAVLCMFVPVT